MSTIHDVVVHVDTERPDLIEALTAPLPFDTERGQSLTPLYTGAVCGAVFTSRVYAAALNHVFVDDVMDWFAGLPWRDADCATLTLTGELVAYAVLTIIEGKTAYRGITVEEPWTGVNTWTVAS